jgi:hypothetical protein
MQWSDISGTVGKFAPMLGGLLGGPAGAAIGSVVASALGTGSTPDEVSQALTTNPDAAVKLRQIEADRTVKLQELVSQQAMAQLQANTQALQIAAGDRDSARKREADTKDTFTPRVLALLVTLGFFGVLAYLLAAGKPSVGGDALLVMLGSLGTAWTSICAYYYGSSAGSAEKSRLLAESQPAKG